MMMMTFTILFLIKISVYRVRRIHHGQLEEKKKMKNEASVVNEHSRAKRKRQGNRDENYICHLLFHISNIRAINTSYGSLCRPYCHLIQFLFLLLFFFSLILMRHFSLSLRTTNYKEKHNMMGKL